MRPSQHLTYAESYPATAPRVHSPSLMPLAGVAIYIVTGIFYVFPSGNPQPADLILVITIMATVVGVWRRYPNQPILYLAAAAFMFWVLLVNSFWYVQIGDKAFITKTLFYSYNMIAFLFMCALCFHDFERLKRVLYWSLIISVGLQAIFLLVIPPPPGMSRSIGTFNNPNQMGYWALLSLACFGVIKERQPLSLIDVGFLVAGAFVIIRSLSKAASISGALLILLIVLLCGWRRGSGLLLGCLVVVGATAEIASGGYFGIIDRFTQTEAISQIDQRLSSIGEQEDDNILHRGYYRFFDNPELLVFGAGEGAVARIDRYNDPKEMHSTLGSLLMSYGVVGIGFFFFLLLVVFHRAPLASFAYFAPPMLYGITHNGIRTTLLWFFLALVFSQPLYGRDRKSALSVLFRRPRTPG